MQMDEAAWSALYSTNNPRHLFSARCRIDKLCGRSIISLAKRCTSSWRLLLRAGSSVLLRFAGSCRVDLYLATGQTVDKLAHGAVKGYLVLQRNVELSTANIRRLGLHKTAVHRLDAANLAL